MTKRCHFRAIVVVVAFGHETSQSDLMVVVAPEVLHVLTVVVSCVDQPPLY